MSNANTPAMMAQSMAESLFRENRVLKEHNEHLVRETVKMAADVAAIQRAHDEQKLRLYTEIRSLKEQNALLTVQVQRQREALERVQPSVSAGYELTARLCGIAIVHKKDGYDLIRRESVMDFVMRWRQTIDQLALTAHPQQVKSEDAREERAKAERDAMLYGQGFMIGGKHVPLQDVLIVPPAISAQEPKG